MFGPVSSDFMWDHYFTKNACSTQRMLYAWQWTRKGKRVPLKNKPSGSGAIFLCFELSIMPSPNIRKYRLTMISAILFSMVSTIMVWLQKLSFLSNWAPVSILRGSWSITGGSNHVNWNRSPEMLNKIYMLVVQNEGDAKTIIKRH